MKQSLVPTSQDWWTEHMKGCDFCRSAIAMSLLVGAVETVNQQSGRTIVNVQAKPDPATMCPVGAARITGQR